MTSAVAPSLPTSLAARVFGIAAIALACMVAIETAGRMGWISVGIAGFLVICALTIWRPRYGLYAAVLAVVMCESQPADPVMFPGWMVLSNVSSWTRLSFISFSSVELIVIVTAMVVLAEAVIERRFVVTPQMSWPILAFLGLLFVSIGWGVFRGGSLNKALWETRSLLLAGLVAFLVPIVMPRREHLARLMSLVCIAITLLSIEILYRRFVLYEGWSGRQLDSVFSHETPVFMNFVVVLLLARLIWPASGRQRLMAVVIPLILYAQMLTERRAGWVCLDVALILLAIFVFRLRRRVFYFVVVPLLVVYAGYLAAFWTAEGALAQPARAVRSINAPDQRDQGSNDYRAIEITNVRLNIHASPITGLGFGREYVFYYYLPDLSGGWPFFRYMSHNAILWLWMRMGPLGFIAFLTMIGAGIVRGVQLLKQSNQDRSAPLLVALVSLLLMTAVYSYVDLGLTNVRNGVMLGLALGVIGAWGRSVEIQSPAKVA